MEFQWAIREHILDQEMEALESKDDKKFWSFIKSKTSSKSPIPPSIVNDAVIMDNLEKAEAFSQYFATNFRADNGQSPPSPLSLYE